MSTLATTHPTLLDITKRLDPNGKIDTIAEMLAQTNEIIEDMVWLEGNLVTGHRTTVRTGLPARLVLCVGKNARVSEAILSEEEGGSSLYVYKSAISAKEVLRRLDLAQIGVDEDAGHDHDAQGLDAQRLELRDDRAAFEGSLEERASRAPGHLRHHAQVVQEAEQAQ